MRTTTGGRRAVLQGLSLYLVVWFGCLPLFQAAHLLFADHDHRFCERHHRIEDVPRINDSDRSGSNALVPGRNALFAGERPAILGACAILNHSAFRDLSLITGGLLTTARSELVRVDRECVDEVVRPRTLLLAAPKTSPPRVAA